ncbi:MAG TPA: LamG domain-containing protein [Vicinamibacteria bacterium]|nr:LamG domain-containing protein [Vicinamibacteria bacterium]
MRARAGVGVALGLVLFAPAAPGVGEERAASDRPVAWWSFDGDPEGGLARDQAAGITDPVEGRFTRVPGAIGRAIRLDGFTSLLRRSSAAAPALDGAFTAEAWVALATYPWNWAPILDHERDRHDGFYFGIGPLGEVGLELSLDGRWETCRTDRVLELRRFTHLAGTFDPLSGIALYVDGKLARRCDARGRFQTAAGLDLLVGMNHEKRVPSHPVRPQATLPAWYTLDGIVDEVKLYAAARPAEALQAAVAAARPPAAPDIPPRVMPSGPKGPGRFGAFYTSLAYYPEWDALWRTSEHADVVVQFDGSPLRVVFWRGTRYSPAWVMEDGTWMADQSAEHFTNHEGCFEHMLDPQNRYSHVRIIENSEARVVVHWRYAPVSVRQEFSQPDERTGWSDWVDEYYTFFPDGLAVRKVVMWTSGRPLGPSEFIVLTHPGSRPEDVIHLDALTLVNLEGESHVYSWAEETPDFTKEERPRAPVIQVVNLKSQHKPFEIFEPGARMRVFRIEQRREVSHFPWWNHWPEAQIASDGRYAVAPDRPSHFSLSWGGPPIHKRDDGAYYATWLYGATTKPVAADLARLARSWAQAPALQSSSAGFEGGGYDRTQRAYVLRRTGTGTSLTFRIDASEANPLENASVLIGSWGETEPAVEVDGRVLRRKDGLRVGHVRRLDGTDLVLWLPVRGTRPVSVRVWAPATTASAPR